MTFKKKEKGYSEKRTARISEGGAAKPRVKHLRDHAHVAHVVVGKSGDHCIVSYSVAKRYLGDLDSELLSFCGLSEKVHDSRHRITCLH